MPLRFVFALHNHQPVGNFGEVFEAAYQSAYRPFLDLMEGYPEIPISLHTSGPLLEWLIDRHPEYIQRVADRVARGQIEILGGGFYEPIMTMIPARDRVGQIRTYSAFLEKQFRTRIRGMWIPERVWEPQLVQSLAEAGIEYTVLDDYHFRQAGLEDRQLFGYFLTEDEGRLVRIFPGSERMRYLVPFRDPEESIQYFREVAGQHPDATVVFADDGEKFGSWPETYRHCYENGWLRRFLDALRYHQSWIQLCTFNQALDAAPPAGAIYLPEASYREMTEWAQFVPKMQAYERLSQEMQHDSRWNLMQRFLRGGFWRNFKIKYPETQEMYARMLEVSTQVAAADNAPPDVLTPARQALYRAQCNCPWWHGAFGGLYLPHLRNAVYEHLITAENRARAARGAGKALELRVADFNLDARPEVCLRNSHLAAYVRPDAGGSLYELDVRPIAHNLLATLSRRPETYHDAIRQQAHGGEAIKVKQAGLDRLLQYDPYLRKSLIDHFYGPAATLSAVSRGQEPEWGDAVAGAYTFEVRSSADEAILTLQRPTSIGGGRLAVRKTIHLAAGANGLVIRYRLDALPEQPRPAAFRLAVEFNFAGMAAGAPDRYFYYEAHARAEPLQAELDLTSQPFLGLVDEWRGLDVRLSFTRPAGVWTFPIQTVSRSEGGIEPVHQSTVVMPHWLIAPDEAKDWEAAIELRLDTARAEARASEGD